MLRARSGASILHCDRDAFHAAALYDCAKNTCNVYSRRRAGKVFPHEIDIQETHPKHRKLDSQAALPHPTRDRPADGLRPKAWPLRPSRRDHDAGRLPPWPAGVGGLRPGNRSSCPRAASTFIGSRTGFPVCTQSGVTRCGRCASYAAIIRQTPTYSFPSAAGQSALSVSTGLSSASERPPRCHSRSTPTCCAMPVGSSSPMMATTRGPCSTTLATGTSSTRSGTPKWRPTDSRTFGGTDDGGAGSIAPHGRSSRSKRTTRHIVEITRPAAVGPCAPCAPARADAANRHLSRPDIVRSGASRRRHALPRLALLRPDRSVDLHHQPVRLAFGRLEHRASGSRYCCMFYHPLDHFDRAASLRCTRGAR